MVGETLEAAIVAPGREGGPSAEVEAVVEVVVGLGFEFEIGRLGKWFGGERLVEVEIGAGWRMESPGRNDFLEAFERPRQSHGRRLSWKSKQHDIVDFRDKSHAREREGKGVGEGERGREGERER